MRYLYIDWYRCPIYISTGIDALFLSRLGSSFYFLLVKAISLRNLVHETKFRVYRRAYLISRETVHCPMEDSLRKFIHAVGMHLYNTLSIIKL